MDRVLRDRILVVARRVREWTQAKADRIDLNSHDLTGWCAISAAQMYRELQQANIECEIHMHSEFCCHAFVVVDDHVIDITATQFSEFKNEEIVIMHCKKAEVYEYYRADKQFKDPDALRKYQKKARWPSSQIAFAK